MNKSKRKPIRKRKFNCIHCTYECSTVYQLDCHNETRHYCHKCGAVVNSLPAHDPQCVQVGGANPAGNDLGPPNIDESVFKQVETTHRGELVSFIFKPLQDFRMLADLIESVESPLKLLVEQNLAHYGAIRIKLVLLLTLVQSGTREKRQDVPTSSTWVSVGHKSFIENSLITCISFIITNLNFMCQTKSDMAVDRIDTHYVLIGNYVVPKGRGCNSKLPVRLKNKRGLLNPEGPPSLCFHMCIMMSQYRYKILALQIGKERFAFKTNQKPLKRKEQEQWKRRQMVKFKNYKQYFHPQRINFTEINKDGKGVSLLDLDLFEKNNPEFSVTVYALGPHKKVQIIRYAQAQKSRHVNLLYFENEPGYGHFVLIENMRKFRSEYKSKCFCGICGKGFISTKALGKHNCLLSSACRLKSTAAKFYKFDKPEYTLRQSHLIYFSLQKISVTRQRPEGWVTKQVVVGYNILLLSPEGVSEVCHYYGKKAMSHFLDAALCITEKYLKLLRATNNHVEMTEKECEILNSASKCTFCNCHFDAFDVNHRRVVHHHHYYGNAAILPTKSSQQMILCSDCNLRARQPRTLTAVFFSDGPHDFHLIAKGIDCSNAAETVTPLSRKGGQMVGLILNKILRIVNFANFRMDGSIWDLVSEMMEAGQPFPCLDTELNVKKCPEMLELFSVTQFPLVAVANTSEFFGILRGDFNEMQIGEKDRDLALRICEKFKISTFEQYFSQSNLIRTLILADLFENFRTMSMQYYSLDPSHVYTGGRYTLDAAFFYDRAEVELVTDKRLVDIVERGLRGGVVLLSEFFVKANTKRYGHYDPSIPTTNILSMDLNGQYAHALCKQLPMSDYQFLDQSEIDRLNLMDLATDGEYSYLLDVHLHIPDHLHFYLQSYPPVCEKRAVDVGMLSSVQIETMNRLSSSVRLQEERLMSTLFDKTSNIHHVKNIQFFLTLGIEIKKIHSVVKYRQAFLFKKYVMFNTEKRISAQNKLVDQFHKNYNNFLTGRLSLSPNQYSTNKYCKSAPQFRKYFAQHNFEDVSRISKRTSLFQFKKSESTNVNFRLISLVVYELAKLELLQKIYYEFMPLFSPLCFRVIHSHTDSLIAAVTCSDEDYIFKLTAILHLLDTSKLEKSHPLYSPLNARKLGKMKIQDGIVEFCGLRASCYSLLFQNDVEICKTSGIPHSGNEQYLKHQNFVNTYSSGLLAGNVVIPCVKIVNGNVMEVRLTRQGLHNLDVSRFRIGNYSLPFGHCLLKNYSTPSL